MSATSSAGKRHLHWVLAVLAVPLLAPPAAAQPRGPGQNPAPQPPRVRFMGPASGGRGPAGGGGGGGGVFPPPLLPPRRGARGERPRGGGYQPRRCSTACRCRRSAPSRWRRPI